jgi:hypothetical protein
MQEYAYSYIGEREKEETDKRYKRLVYEIQSLAQHTKTDTIGMRMQLKFPHAKWKAIWKNINNKILLPRIRTIWYTIVHDIIPTNSRLHDINLHTTGNCQYCGKRDTLIHRLTACADTQILWSWMKNRVACYLRISAKAVEDVWITLPDFEIYPPQRQNATIWMIGHMLGYVYDNQSVTLQDFLDFLKRARWKEYNRRSTFKRCGIYLDVIDY